MRFVDLRPAEIAGVRFAFWDTALDQFVEDKHGDQAWGTWEDFVETMHPPMIERFYGLLPSWVHEELSEDEEQGMKL